MYHKQILQTVSYTRKHQVFSSFHLKNIRFCSSKSQSHQSPKIYGFDFSQPTRSVLLLCHAESIAHEFVNIDVFKGEARKKEFLQRNPNGLVPLWEDPLLSHPLAECCAILQFLSESRNVAKHWYPLTNATEDINHRSRINSWMHWHHSNSRLSTKVILLGHKYPAIYGQPDSMKRGIKAYSRAMAIMDEQLSKTRFLTGEQLSIADLVVLPEVDQLTTEAFGLFDYKPYTHIIRWLKDSRTALGTECYDLNFAASIREGKK